MKLSKKASQRILESKTIAYRFINWDGGIELKGFDYRGGENIVGVWHDTLPFKVPLHFGSFEDDFDNAYFYYGGHRYFLDDFMKV